MELPNTDKSFLVNPRMRLKIFGDEDMMFETRTGTIEGLFMDIDIDKDMDEEPNQANVIVYGLAESSRKAMIAAADQNAPIEIYLTPAGVDELVLASRGELDSAKNSFMSPGHATELRCMAQKTQHLFAYVQRFTYKKGTPMNTIAQDFIDAIGMPTQMESIPNTGILLSQSYGGPAFPLLKRFVEDMGMYCFVNDGVLHISSIYSKDDETPKEIKRAVLMGTPEETEVTDTSDVNMRTISRVVNIDPLKKIKRRRKKKKEEKIVGKSDYVRYDVVDQSIPGMDFVLHCQPDLQPDDLVVFPDYEPIKSTLFRIMSVNHEADNESFDRWTTRISTRVYNPSSGDALAGII